MLKSEIKKGDWIVFKMPKALPWYVYGKEYGFVLIRRQPNAGKMIALKQGQLRDFEKYEKEKL